MFQLKTSPDQLSSANVSMGSFNYRQLPPDRSARGAQFSSSAIHFRWTTSGTQWVDLSRSFVRMRLKITKGDGAILTTADDAALGMDAMACMFQSCEFRIADEPVSKVQDFVPQVSALKHRADRSRAWLETVGKSAQVMERDFYKRQSMISSDGFAQDPSWIPQHLIDDSPAGAEVGSRSLIFDYATPNQVQITAANLLIFTANGGRAIPDLRNHFKIGDWIALNDGAEKLRQVTVVAADRLTVGGAALTPVGAANLVNQVRVLPQPVNMYHRHSQRAGGVELSWQPPLGVFDLPHALPAGRYELILTPKTGVTWQEASVESKGVAKVFRNDGAGPATEIHVDVEQIYLDLAEIQGRRAPDMVYYLDLMETRCQRNNITTAGGSTQVEFTTEPSTVALACAFQNQEAGSSSLYSPSLFKVRNDQELSLNRLYLEYAGQKRPQTDADPVYRVSATAPEDYTVARYMDTMTQTGGYFRSGGTESIEEWHERGPYYYFSWPKDGSDRSTRVLLTYQFANDLSATGTALLFQQYRRAAAIRLENGEVVDVRVQNQ